jgi:hypothetical protein
MSGGNRFPAPQTPEERAEYVATYFDPFARKVSDDFREIITQLRVDFRGLKKGDRIMECRTWTEFCSKVLKRTDRAVRYIIAGGNPRSKRKSSEAEEFDPYEHWRGMPEFDSDDLEPFRTLFVHFENEKHVEKFAALVRQPITPRTRFIYYPKAKRSDHGSHSEKAYVSTASQSR